MGRPLLRRSRGRTAAPPKTGKLRARAKATAARKRAKRLAKDRGTRNRKGHEPTTNTQALGGPPAHNETVEQMRLEQRRHRAWELLTVSALTYRQIAAQLTQEGMPCSHATVYYDIQVHVGELRERTAAMASSHGERMVATAQRILRHALAHLKDPRQAKVALAAMDFEARVRGTYAPTRMQAVSEDTRPFAALTDAELEAQVQEMLAALEATPRGLPAAGAVVDVPAHPEKETP